MDSMSDAQLHGPLTGVSVLDFTSFIAGSYCAQLLGDLGADVIKVEALTGDAARFWGPFLNGESRFFQGWNRNKRSIAVDLQSEKGREIVYELVKRTDIVVENFRPGITRKLRIDYDALKPMNESLIYLSITAFGAKGPYGERPGYDPILQSLSGAARGNLRYCASTGICSVAVSDYGAALLGSTGLLAALFHRERSGQGQFIETSLLQAAMAVQSHMFIDALDTKEEPPFGIYPYKYFNTSDDILFIACGTDRFWRIFCECIGMAELGTHADYATNPQRVEHADHLTAIVQERMSTKSTKEWEMILLAKGVPCAPAQTYQDFFDDPQVHALGMFPTIEHRAIGRTRVAGVPITMHNTPGSIRCAAPTLGEHGAAILAEIGYNDGDIDRLRAESIVA